MTPTFSQSTVRVCGSAGRGGACETMLRFIAESGLSLSRLSLSPLPVISQFTFGPDRNGLL